MKNRFGLLINVLFRLLLPTLFAVGGLLASVPPALERSEASHATTDRGDKRAQLCRAAMKGNLDLVRHIHQQGGYDLAYIFNYKSPDKLDQCQFDGYCAIHIAIACDHLDIVKYVIEKMGLNPDYKKALNFTTGDLEAGNTAGSCYRLSADLPLLHFAIIKGRFDIAKYFAQTGADLDAKVDIYAFGVTRLDIRHANVTPIILAKIKGAGDMVDFLKSNRALCMRAMDKHVRSAEKIEGFGRFFCTKNLLVGMAGVAAICLIRYVLYSIRR